MNKTLLASSLLLSLGMLSGCSDNDNANSINTAFEKERQRQSGELIESISITGGGIRIEPGDELQLKATGVDSKGDSRDITKEVIWQSSHPDFASINDEGKITAKAQSDTEQGLVTFTATTINDVSESIEVSIKDIQVASLTLSANSARAYACQPNTITTAVTYDDGYQGTVDNNKLTWEVAGSATAYINDFGVLYTSDSSGDDLQVRASYAQANSNQLSFTTAPTQITSIRFVDSDEQSYESLDLDLGERETLQVRGALNEQSVDVTPGVNWAENNNAIAYIETNPRFSGAVLATEKGDGLVYASCSDSVQDSISLSVTSAQEGELSAIFINDNSETISLNAGESTEIRVYADYTGFSDNINVTDASTWIINNSLVTATLNKRASDEVYLNVTAKPGVSGDALMTFGFLEQEQSVIFEISN
ncbi:hypothetical protein [Pseudoalteromonas ruthenica]|nr:hypothetical protein [Pseudoalteromonas ruthenica]